MLTSADGRSIPLNQVAEVVIEEGPNQVQREDAKRRISVAFNVRDRDVQSVVEEVQSKIDKQVKLPPGYYVQFGGQFENLSEAKNRLMIAVPLALLLILLILYFSFGSIRYGLLIYSAIPLSAIGGILFLWIRDMPFSISAGIGFIALFGVAVLNGIVLISEFNSLKSKQSNNLNVDEIALEGTVSRLRPVLMTAAVASLGFLPMALSTSSGAEVQRPLATVVIGGLISATLLTLFVLPVLYVWVEKRKQRKMKNVVISMLLFVLPALGNAQTVERVIPVDSILKFADEHAYVLKIDEKRILQNELFKNRPLQIPNTSVGMEYGNINSAYNDTRFFLNQGLPLPVVYKRQKEVYQKNIEVETSKRKLDRAELHLTVRQLSYRVMDLDRRAKLLDEMESNFKEWRRIAQLQSQQGEIQKAIFSAIDVQYNQNKLQKEQLISDRISMLYDLKQLINANELFVPALNDEYLKDGLTASSDISIEQHPSLQLSGALIEERKTQTLLNKSKLLPDFNLGYSNLSIIGWQSPDGINQKYYGSGRRFGIYQLGLSIPLFTGGTKAKIKSSELDIEIAQMEQYRQAALLKAQLSKLLITYQQAQKANQYYKNEGLPIADEIQKQASLRLKSGDINFAEWNLLVGQSLQIRLSHVVTLYEMQMAIAEYIYLTEKN
jgi:cobalt-zinc-cadmium resistance protein CzcA